jgi:predicted transcriptional regulator
MTPSRGKLSRLVEELLAEAVDSFEKLEIVLQLHRSPDGMSTHDLATAIAIPDNITSEAVKQLAHSRVVVASAAVWKLAGTGPWCDHLAPLIQAAEADRTELFRFLTTRAMDRVRAEAARVFADAFVLKPKKKGGSDA